MKNNSNKKIGYRLTALMTAAAFATAAPMTVLAEESQSGSSGYQQPKDHPDDNAYQSPGAPAPNYNKDLTPEFAYSAEKWASLRDNVMEYEELADLVHEYNPCLLYTSRCV